MAASKTVRYSLLDLAPILPGSTAAASFRNSLDLARHVEPLGYHRYWLAEHHNIPGIASAATSVVITYIAGGTERMRIGAGGVMLPNHAPLVIAEQFGTLESLFPGRIDLGLGRAPGGDMATARALRRNLGSSVDTFPQDVRELRAYFAEASPEQRVRAIPGQGLKVPLYLLGSSDYSARLAAMEGLPFAFASHFAPDYLPVALDLYRAGFRASDQLERAYVMVGVNVFAAETDKEAYRQFTTLQQMFLSLLRGTPRRLAPPIDSMEGVWNEAEEQQVMRMARYSAVGSPATVQMQLQAVIDETRADELILTCMAYDHEARKRSFEIGAAAMKAIGASLPGTGAPRAV